MTTQRDRLAAAIHDALRESDDEGSRGNDSAPLLMLVVGSPAEWADALLARGVRVVDAETLAAALLTPLDDYGICRACGDYTDRSTLSVRVFDTLAALDGEADR